MLIGKGFKRSGKRDQVCPALLVVGRWRKARELICGAERMIRSS